MGKNPAFLFYPSDWQRDLDDQDLEIEGAWIRICCRLWWSNPRGKATRSLKEWSNILRTHPNKTGVILKTLLTKNIANGEYLDNQNITIISRRMMKDEEIRKIRREVGKLGGNPALKKHDDVLLNQNPNQNVLVSVSVSDSVSNKEDLKAANAGYDISHKIRIASEFIYKSGNWDKVNAFVNRFKNHNKEALLHTLEQFIKYSANGRKIDSPWSYCLEIMKIENGNFNEREAIAAHNAIKDITKDFKLSDITKGEKNEKVATKEA